MGLVNYAISIRSKLLGAFLVVAFLAIGAGYVNILEQKNVAHYADAVEHAYSRSLALLEMKNTASEIDNEVVAMLGSVKKYATQAEGSTASDQKYKLLASLELLDKWKVAYEKNIDTSQQTNAAFVDKIDGLKNGIVDTALHYVDLQEQGKEGSIADDAYRMSLISVDALKSDIESAVTEERHSVQISIEMSDTSEAHAVTINYVISLLIVLVALGLGMYLNNHIVGPVRKVRNAVVSIASGDFTKRVPVVSKDEIGELAQVFNDMTSQLEQSNKIMEQKVEVRTSELKKKIEETEHMNKLMVDRELKMIELKKENDDLQKKLGISASNS